MNTDVLASYTQNIGQGQKNYSRINASRLLWSYNKLKHMTKIHKTYGVTFLAPVEGWRALQAVGVCQEIQMLEWSVKWS